MKNPSKNLFAVFSRFSTLAIMTMAVCGASSLSAQTNGTWTLNGSGDWSTPANWDLGDVASGAGAIADFSTLDLTANQTVNLDAPFTIGALTAGDFTTASNNWAFSGSSVLTLDNGASSPLITVTNQNTTISAPLAGTGGLTKAGAGVLFLTDNNSALSGTLTVQDVAGTNNNGVVVTTDTAIGGITSVNIQGSGSSGGFFQLEGGVSLPGTVGITLNSPGGHNFPPGGIRSTGAGFVNTIQGPINVTLNNSRISNNSAQRLDITGAITGGSNTILFRNSANEGIHITNTGNSWTGQTQAHEGIFWFDPGALPANSNLILGNSGATSVQTSGTFSRALGTAGDQVQFNLSASRNMGFSARGGDLSINFGGTGATILFNSGAGAPASAIRTNQLWLNNSTADSKLTLVNPLDLNGGDRIFVVDANVAELTGGIIGSNAITKSGAGTLRITPALSLAAARTINVNAGILEAAGGFTGNATLTKGGNALLRVPTAFDLAATQTLAVNAGTAELSGGVSGGTFTLTKSGAGILHLSTASTWTGNLATSTGGSANSGTVRVSHSLGLGAAETVKTISMRGDNRSTSILELSGGVDIDANKTFNMSGKSFYAAGNATTGIQYSMRSASGVNTWRGNVVIAETGGAYGLESLSGSTLVIGADTSTASTLRNTAGGTRTMSFFGAGDFILNSKFATNGTSLTSAVMSGSGTLTLARADNDFTVVPNFNSGTTEVTKMSLNGAPSSIGTATSFNLGGTLRYTGTGDVSNRTLGVSQKGATLDADGTGPLQLTSNSFVNLVGSTSLTTAPFGSGAFTLTVNDASAVAIGQSVTGTNIPVGATITAIDVAARTITLSQATSAASANAVAITIAGADDLDRTLTLDGSQTGDNLLAGNLSNPAGTGKLSVSKTGPGKWILSGAAKTNTGALDVQAGVLELQNTGFPASSATVASGATLVLNKLGSPLTVTGALTLDGNIIAFVPGEPTSGTYDVVQYGSVTGAGTLTSPFRGTTNLGATTGSFTIAPGIPLTWTGAANSDWDVINSFNWQDGSSNPETFHLLDSVTFNSVGAAQPNVTLVGELRTGGVTVNENTVDYTLGGSGFISGSGGLTKSGTATLNLNTANTFTGDVTIHGGTIRLGNNQALGANGQIVTINSGGMLDLNGAANVNRDYQATIAGTGVGSAGAIVNSLADLNSGVGSLTLAANASIGGDFRWDIRPITAGTGFVDLGGFTLTKSGSNIVALVDGTLSNAGTINVDQGILGITRMVVSGTGSVNVTNGAILRFENNTTGSWTDKPVGLNDGTINMFGSNYILDAEVTLTNTGTFDIGSSRVMTLSRKVTGSGGLTMNVGTGTLVLNAANDYSGPTLVSAGSLLVGNRVASGSLGTADVTNNATLRFARRDSATVANNISGTGGVIIGANVAVDAEEYDAITTLSGNNSFAGNITLFSGGLRILDETGVGTGPKDIVVGTTNGTNGRPQFYLDGTAGDITLPADISLRTSNAQLTHPAIGNIAGNNSIEGPIILTSGGGSTSVKVLGGSLALNGPISAITSGRFLVLAGNPGSNGTVNGLISNGTNPLGLIKSEGNTWTLAGDNTYTATTTINAGTLLINGNQSAATGAITVGSSATLGGTGASGGAVTVNNGGTLAPGDAGIESLDTGALNLASGSTLAIEINTNAAAADQVAVTGNVDLTGTVDLTLTDLGSNAALPPGTKLVIVDYTGTWDDADVVTFNGNPVPNESTITVGANTFIVDYSDAALGGTAMTLSIAGSSDPYLGWATLYSLTGGDRAPDADPDNDGLENGIEFVIGSDPTLNTPAGNRPSANVVGGNLVFTFKRSDESESFDVFVEYGTTLASWPGQIAIPAGAFSDATVTVINNDPGLDDVTVSIPVGTDPKKFARLRADIPFTP